MMCRVFPHVDEAGAHDDVCNGQLITSKVVGVKVSELLLHLLDDWNVNVLNHIVNFGTYYVHIRTVGCQFE